MNDDMFTPCKLKIMNAGLIYKHFFDLNTFRTGYVTLIWMTNSISSTIYFKTKND